MGARREKALAQLFHALRQGVEDIKASVSCISQFPMALRFHHSSLAQHAPSFPPAVPRLYPTCLKLDGTEAPITFSSVFRASSDKPIFNAELNGFGAVLAKMANHSYGVGVHRFLAERDFAPQLLGECTLEGCPTIYVMERLDDSWVTLAAWSEETDAIKRSLVHPRIHSQLTKIIGLLEGGRFVHGDLRATNVMIKKDSYQLKVVDFDWAGQAGQVHYPFERNQDIMEWPGRSEPGGVIVLGDDRALFENWWVGYIG